MRYFLIFVLIFIGCRAQPEIEPQAPIAVHKTFFPAVSLPLVYMEECCFYCSEIKLVRISYGPEVEPGTVGYGNKEFPWKYHCMACGKPTTGDLDRDFELKK